MSSNYAIGEPHIIASLPRPFNSENGKLRASPVYSLEGSRKRKRNEIVAGIDGEAVNVYHVGKSQLVTSYPIPPQSCLSCPPCCAYYRSLVSKRRRRYTYVALRRSAQSSSQRMIGFVEDAQTKDNVADANTSLAKLEYDLEDHDAIAHIEPLHTSSAEEGPNLLIVTTTGKVELRSADLQQILQRFDVIDSSKDSVIEFVALQTASEATRGFLRNRPDVIASLAAAETIAGSAAKDPHVLLVISSSGRASDKQEYTAGLWNMGGSTSSNARLLESWHLPVSSTISENSTSTFALEPTGGALYRLSERALASLKLSAKATAVTEVQLPSSGPYQMLPISKTALLLAHQGTSFVFDSRYGCLYSTRHLHANAPPSSRKRKRAPSANEASAAPTQVITWHSKTDTAVVLHGRDILTLHVHVPKTPKRSIEPRLVDAFARGASSVPSHSMSRLDASLLARVDELLATKKLKQFDRSFSELTSALPEGDRLKGHFDQVLASKALAAIFSWDTHLRPALDRGRQPSINVRLAPRGALDWLSSNGYLTSEHISKALQQDKSLNELKRRSISSFDLIGALAKHDSSLQTLAAFTRSTSYLPLEGWVESLRYFMTSFEGQSSNHARSDLLINGQKPQQPPSEKLNPQAGGQKPDEEQDNEMAESILANTDIDLALSLLEPEHAQLRGQALRQTLTHLGVCYAASSLTPALRSGLAHNDTLLLIDLLRIELAHSGWTGRQLDKPSLSEGGINPADEAIHLIAKLLNCCVDALGIGGWLGLSSDAQPTVLGIDGGGLDSDVEPPDTHSKTNKEVLNHLRHATTFSLEAAQESAFFANFLTDFMRYNVNLAAAEAQDRIKKRARINRAVLVDAGPEANMLPLGPKSVEPISQYRVDAGGEVKERSVRDIARKESRKLGAYTFERIRV